MRAAAAVHRCDDGLHAERLEFIFIENILRRVEAENGDGRFARGKEALGKAEERRGADAAARKERRFAAGGNVKAVAETRERIKRLPRRAAGEPVRSAADDFIKERDALFVPVADGDGPAQEETGQAKVEELARRGDGRGVALELQAVDARGDGGVFRDGVGYFDQSVSS